MRKKNCQDRGLVSYEQQFATEMVNEVERASAKHPPLNSAHEAYAVILEELDEFWEEVCKRKECRDSAQMRKELLHTAAMCCRAALDLDL